MRHALTTGHCICGKTVDNQNQGLECKKETRTTHQITSDNKINVRAGSNDVTSTDMIVNNIQKAWVIYDEERTFGTYYDIHPDFTFKKQCFFM